MGPFINLSTGGCNWLSQGGDTCVLATVAIRGVFGVFLEVFLGGARYFEVVLAPSRHLKWCIDKRWWQPICELIGELMKEEMPARWARPLPEGNPAPPTHPQSVGVWVPHPSWGAACTLLSVLVPRRPRGVSGKKVCATRSCPSPSSLPCAGSQTLSCNG